MLKRKAILSALSAELLLAGCAGLVGFRRPELTFRGVEVFSVGLEGATLDLLLDVYNPNSFRLGLERLTYDLTVESARWGVGETTAPRSVEGGSSATLRLPLRIDWPRLGDVGRDVLRTGTVNYGVSGNVTVSTPRGKFKVPYDRTGRFNVFGADGR